MTSIVCASSFRTTGSASRLHNLASLTRYAVRWRYPNDAEAPTTDDAQAALAQAGRIVGEVTRDLADHEMPLDKSEVTGE